MLTQALCSSVVKVGKVLILLFCFPCICYLNHHHHSDPQKWHPSIRCYQLSTFQEPFRASVPLLSDVSLRCEMFSNECLLEMLSCEYFPSGLVEISPSPSLSFTGRPCPLAESIARGDSCVLHFHLWTSSYNVFLVNVFLVWLVCTLWPTHLWRLGGWRTNISLSWCFCRFFVQQFSWRGIWNKNTDTKENIIKLAHWLMTHTL